MDTSLRGLGMRALWFVFGIMLVVLAIEHNLGKALACLIAPGVLEVDLGNTDSEAVPKATGTTTLSFGTGPGLGPEQSIRQRQQSSKSIR